MARLWTVTVPDDPAGPYGSVTYACTGAAEGDELELNPGALLGPVLIGTADSSGSWSQTLDVRYPIRVLPVDVSPSPAPVPQNAELKALQVSSSTTAPDSVSLTIEYAKSGGPLVIDFGDRSAPLTIDDPKRTVVLPKQYTDPGHHDYTVTATSTRVPAALGADTLESLVGLPSETLADIAKPMDTLGQIPAPTERAMVSVSVDVGEATVWATVLAGNPERVQVDTWIGRPDDVATWELVRRAEGLQDLVIKIGTGPFAGMSIEDFTAPFTRALTYLLRVTYKDGSTFEAVSEPVWIDARGCWITDPGTGWTVRAEIQSWPEREYEERQSVLAITGRRYPVVLSDVHTAASGTWNLITRSDAATDDLMRVLTASRVVLLRPSPGTSIRSVYAAVGKITEARLSGHALDDRRLTTVEIQEIEPIPAAALALASTLLGLSKVAETLLALSAVRPTLSGLSRMRV